VPEIRICCPSRLVDIPGNRNRQTSSLQGPHQKSDKKGRENPGAADNAHAEYWMLGCTWTLSNLSRGL